MVLETRHIPSERDQYRDRLEGYLAAILKLDVRLQDWYGQEALPVFLTRLYEFFETRVGQFPVLFMFAKSDDGHTPKEIGKHLDLVKGGYDGIVVYSAERLTASSRARLIAAGVAFAVPGNQLFIPELATDLREHFRGPKPKRPDKLSPSAQLVLFFHLLNGEPGQQWTPTEMTEPLRYSVMTMSRAFEELAAVSLAQIERRGRKKLMSFCAEGRLLIDIAKTLLIRPERRVDHIRWRKKPWSLPLAGEHALARLTDLSPPATLPAYAVTSDQMRELIAEGWVNRRDAEYGSDGALATWRYDPRVLARNQMVDPLSLFAQFWWESDERLSMAVDQLLERWTW